MTSVIGDDESYEYCHYTYGLRHFCCSSSGAPLSISIALVHSSWPDKKNVDDSSLTLHNFS
jgi:hypothetical protein